VTTQAIEIGFGLVGKVLPVNSASVGHVLTTWPLRYWPEVSSQAKA